MGVFLHRFLPLIADINCVPESSALFFFVCFFFKTRQHFPERAINLGFEISSKLASAQDKGKRTRPLCHTRLPYH